MSTRVKRPREKVPIDDPRWAFHTSTETPEQMLEDLWPYFDMTPEERDLECQSVCRGAGDQWNALPPEHRERAEWFDAYEKRRSFAILARWAREYRERTRKTE